MSELEHKIDVEGIIMRCGDCDRHQKGTKKRLDDPDGIRLCSAEGEAANDQVCDAAPNEFEPVTAPPANKGYYVPRPPWSHG